MRALCSLAVGLGLLACASPPTLQDARTAAVFGRDSALREPGAPRRVIVLTIAGLEAADFLDPWGRVVAEGAATSMPVLARLAREGAIGVEAIPPPPGSTYATHATLATGKRPAGHGVIADQALDQEGNRALPYWDNRLLRGPALWDAAIARGALGLGWPTTSGARIELVVPDALPDESGLRWLDLIQPLSTPVLTRELAEIEKVALAAERDRDPSGWPTPAEKDAAFVSLACSIVASERDPGLWLIRLSQTGEIQRSAGFGSVEVVEALGRIDAELGRLIGCLEAADQLADSAIFVVGDVAYRPVHTRVDPNVALVRRGLIGRDPRSSTGVRSWLAISRSSGRSAYVYARDQANALAARKLLESEAARTGAFDVVPASALARAGADPQAWFGLAARPGYLLGNRLVGDLIQPAEARSGAGGLWIAEDASSPGRGAATGPAGAAVGLVAWGRGIRPQVRIPTLDLVDFAPTVAALLGLRLDSEIDGTPLIGLLRAAVPPPPPGPKRLGMDHGDDLERTLRTLGGSRDLGRDR